METLEIDYKNVFETLPGKNALLLPDFTIAAATDDYIADANTTREKAEGKNILLLLKEVDGYTLINDVIEGLSASLQRVMIFKEADTIDVLQEWNSDNTVKKYRRLVNKPVLSPEGEVLYIIHYVSEFVTEDRAVKKEKPVNGKTPSLVELGIGSRFFNLILQTPVAMGILSGDEMILEIANQQMLDLWGKTSDIIGLPIIQALPEILDQPFPELLSNVYKTGTPYQGFETSAILKRNGKPVEAYFNFVYTPLRDQKGDIAGIVMVAAEVTSLVVAKKALEESEKRYRDLIRNATVATAVYTGEDFEISIANDAMLKLWGKDSSVIGKKLREAVPELDGQPFIDLLQKVYATGETYFSSEDKASLVINGKLESSYFNFTYKALRDTAGHIYGILNMAVDVSETVNARLEIKDAEERWRIALNAAELGAFDYYPVTERFFCSARTRQLFGISETAVLTFEEVFLAIHPRDRKKVRQQIASALKLGKNSNYNVEFEITGIEDKKRRWLRASGHAFF